MSRIILRACTAGLVAAAMATSSFAASTTVVATREVKTADLDLSTARGADILLRRVKSIATDLCAAPHSQWFRGVDQEERQCRDEAVARTISQVSAPLVHDEYQRLFGAQPIQWAAR